MRHIFSASTIDQLGRRSVITLSSILDKLSVIVLAIRPSENPMPMHLVLGPLALVALAVSCSCRQKQGQK